MRERSHALLSIAELLSGRACLYRQMVYGFTVSKMHLTSSTRQHIWFFSQVISKFLCFSYRWLHNRLLQNFVDGRNRFIFFLILWVQNSGRASATPSWVSPPGGVGYCQSDFFTYMLGALFSLSLSLSPSSSFPSSLPPSPLLWNLTICVAWASHGMVVSGWLHL